MRSAFEQDFDRIIFSHPFRRLQDKTQVHPLPEHDFVHTRLTHSLEVSSVGRSLGKLAGETILQRHPHLDATVHDFGSIVAAACLAHDLGNPPFGHTGEDALSDFFRTGAGSAFKPFVSDAQWHDLTHFEGNAQGFRLLNKSQYQGLRLTYATLGAFTKYPCASLLPAREPGRRSQKKFGFFQSELHTFTEVAEALRLLPAGQAWRRHPLAFLVEAADDICYHIIDLEDGCRLGLVSFTDTVDMLAAILGPRYQASKLERYYSKEEKIGVLRALAIRQLVAECLEVFNNVEAGLLQGTFDQALTEHIVSRKAFEEIGRVSVEKIYRAPHVTEREAAGYEILPGLLQIFTEAGKLYQQHLGQPPKKWRVLIRLLPAELVHELGQHPTDTYGMLRLMLDFISGLTDRHAVSLYRKLKGIAL